MDPPRSRCSDSYFISRQAAKVISEAVQPFSMPIDWELGYQLHLHRMKVYWWEPPLVRQGSETGLYRSEVRDEWHHKKTKFKIWRAWESLKSKL
jgi:GR25 family glycosyltransferase involved in LPS biosynthesis